MGLLVSACTAATYLLVWSVREIRATGASISAHALAQERLEQLASLTWHVRGDGSAVSDTTTNLAEQPATTLGHGLSPSPAGTLDRNVPGYVDYLDEDGQWVGTGMRPPGRAVFVRRWAVLPYASDPADTLVLQVRVLPMAVESARTTSQLPGEALLITAVTRVRQ
jgi:hypothetical protein